MTFRVSEHAQKRLLNRRVTIKDVEHILQNPEDRLEREDGYCEYQGLAGGRRLMVVLDERQDPPALVTVHTLPRR